MRWNVVIGGQAFSESFAGFVEYSLPVVPRSLETLKEGAEGALFVITAPFALFTLLSRILPVSGRDPSH